jgi:hypothetical protein
MFATLSSRPMVTHVASKKKFLFFFGGIIFLVSSNKSNDLLYLQLSLAIMATSHIEPQLKLKQEMVLFVLIACSLFAFFSQL